MSVEVPQSLLQGPNTPPATRHRGRGLYSCPVTPAWLQREACQPANGGHPHQERQEPDRLRVRTPTRPVLERPHSVHDALH